MKTIKGKFLCKPLTQLKAEHDPLLNQMENIIYIVHKIQQGSFEQEWNTKCYQLYQNVVAFLYQFKLHTYKEEHFLFPLLKKYLEEEEGPLLLMDYEHKKAEQFLKQFIETFEKRSTPFGEIEVMALLSCLEIANQTIIDHFRQEVKVLFPLAEQYLTESEKKELSEKMSLFS